MSFDFIDELEEEEKYISLEALLVVESDLCCKPNVGVVKQEVQHVCAKSYWFSFPIEIDMTIELLDFREEE